MKNNIILFGILALLISGGTYLYVQSHQPTSAQKLSECQVNASKIYDTARQTIAKNSNDYSEVEQATYYKRTSDSYASSLASCQQLYSQ